MTEQKSFRLTLPPRSPDVPAREHRFNLQALNGGFQRESIPPEKLLADLLKRQATSAMEAVTENPAATLAAHLTTLDNVIALLRHVINQNLGGLGENSRSERQLVYAVTLADYLEACLITRRAHRAPVWTSHRDAELAVINRKLDLLAAHLAHNGGAR